MKVLVIGKNGQLGWELTRRLPRRGIEVTAVDLPEFDVTRRSDVMDLVKSAAPDFIINACAYTAVDRAESEPELAHAVNQMGPGYIAEACDNRIPMVHISTDYVFDGTKTGAYTEDDPIAPLGVYGQSKAMGEQAVAVVHEKHIIIRTAWLCGVHGHNFVKTMLRLGKECKTLNIVDDQYGCPTFAFDLAEAIVLLADRCSRGGSMTWGIYHYCGKGEATWYRFGKEIFELARAMTPLSVENIAPVPTEAYPTPAKRPANSVLSCDKIERNFGIKTRLWQPRLEKMLEILKADNAI